MKGSWIVRELFLNSSKSRLLYSSVMKCIRQGVKKFVKNDLAIKHINFNSGTAWRQGKCFKTNQRQYKTVGKEEEKS